MEISNIINHFERLPFSSIISKRDKQKIKTQFEIVGQDINPNAYINFSIICTFVCSLYISGISLLILQNVFTSLLLLTITLLLTYLLSKKMPGLLANRKVQKIEADLPLVLRIIGTQMDIKIPFEKIIAELANEDYEISNEFKKVNKEIKSGSNVTLALTNMAERINSRTLKRSINQIIISYDKGGDGQSVKRMASELIDLQYSKLKEFEAKMSFMGLIFIATSALLPTFFEIYIAVGTMIMGGTITVIQLWITFVFIFPILDLIVLLMIYLNSPVPIKTTTNKTDKYEILNNIIFNKYNINIKQTGPLIVILTTFIALIFFGLGLIFNTFFFLIGFIIFISPTLIYFYAMYKTEQRILEIERNLPDALLQAAAMQSNSSTEAIIHELSKAKYGALSEEYKIASRQLKAGSDLSYVLENMSDRNNSTLIKRTNKLLIYGHYAGANMYTALRETAEDIFSLFSLIRERKAVMTMQKYTVIIGGAIIVPLILGIVIQMITSLNIESMATYLTGNDANLTTELLEQSVLTIQVYMIIYSAISSVLLAQQEGETNKFIIYFIFMAMSAIFLFNMALSIKLI